jgi:uncharacterized membrane protein SpoIIM required for sporulation
MSEEKDNGGESVPGETGQIAIAAALGSDLATSAAVAAGLTVGLPAALAIAGLGATIGMFAYALANRECEWGGDGSAGAS